MSEFSDNLIATRADHLAVFGEAVQYVPAVGEKRDIIAVVHRGRPDLIAESGYAESATVHVANDATIGISSAEIDVGGGDAINYSVRIGETAEDRRIAGIVDMDEGMLELELR